MNRPIRQALFVLGLLLLVAAAICDRGHWAQVAQWREDQACNLWLGYTLSPTQLPVGLISSVGTPNPNGMPLLGSLLGRLPNLWAISAALGVVQALLALWVAWLMTGTRRLFFLVALPLLASVVLRATSIEFWNQWILTSFNLCFFGLWICYLRLRSPWLLVLLMLPTLYAPAVYLAGAANAVVYFVFVAGALWLRPPRASRLQWLAASASGVALAVASLLVTWLPYLKAMEGQPKPVPPLTLETALERSLRAGESALDFMPWNLTHWYHATEDSFLHSDPDILGRAVLRGLHQSERVLLALAALFTVTWLLSLLGWLRPRRTHATFFVPDKTEQGWLVLASLAFVWVGQVVSPLLGGPAWAVGERADQQVQLLPFCLLAWVQLPFVIELRALPAVLSRAGTALLAGSFALMSAINGWNIVEAHLNYDGKVLSAADVPLQHRRQAVEFIARDWQALAPGKPVAVSYRMSEAWLADFGAQLEHWYAAPMTLGRAFDFELSRVYGLKNSQEGIQARSSKRARYIVSYTSSKPPRIGRAQMIHHRFGRLRVSVRGPRASESAPAAHTAAL